MQIKDKALFAVALMAAFLAFTAFKDEMSNIYIPLGTHAYSLLALMIFFVCLLALAVYLYALESVRYIFGKYQNFILLRGIVYFANFVYTIAIVFPLIILISWLMSITPLFAFAQKHITLLVLSDFISVGGAIVIGITNSFILFRSNREKESEKIELVKSEYLRKSIELFNSRFYGESILEAFKSLESFMREKLLEKRGWTSTSLSFDSVFEAALKSGIIEEKYIKPINKLRMMRNEAAHFSPAFTREQAESALLLLKEIFEKEA